ncbi:hypothetical protein CPC08DRAFT_101400 [Agrocybe pediades]|nr:hypothetical protein CPC08DRAFT_101400 [Agrocybe pediades]
MARTVRRYKIMIICLGFESLLCDTPFHVIRRLITALSTLYHCPSFDIPLLYTLYNHAERIYSHIHIYYQGRRHHEGEAKTLYPPSRERGERWPTPRNRPHQTRSEWVRPSGTHVAQPPRRYTDAERIEIRSPCRSNQRRKPRERWPAQTHSRNQFTRQHASHDHDVQ